LASSSKKTNPLSTNCYIYKGASIGNRAVLVSCRVSADAVIGDDVRIGEGSIIGKGAVLENGTVVPAGKIVPEKTRWGGNPAQYLGPAEEHH
jgi:carbonic anhydrase/acetyltransferase-like protein (isoleucine patch superfamily)